MHFDSYGLGDPNALTLRTMPDIKHYIKCQCRRLERAFMCRGLLIENLNTNLTVIAVKKLNTCFATRCDIR